MFLYFDCETTGLDPVKNDIIQLAGLVEIDGKVVEEFNLKCEPHSYENVSQEALDVHGIKLEEIKTYPSPVSTKNQFCDILAKHCDKFDKTDKFYPAGYNCRFDLDFVAQWFKKCKDNYFGSWQNWRAIDPFPILCIMDFQGRISLENYKLETVCKHYGIPLAGAHDALNDVKATRELIQSVLKVLLP
jgi:DNA polymerase-3 subunit epsilon